MNRTTLLIAMVTFTGISLLLAGCSAGLDGEWKCQGGLVHSLKFVSSDKVVVNTLGMASMKTSYSIKGKTIRIKTDKLDYVFKVAGPKKLLGQTYAGMFKTGNCTKKE